MNWQPGWLVVALVDNDAGISVNEAKSAFQEIAKHVEEPNVAAIPLNSVDTDGMNSADALYEVLQFAFEPGVIAAASALLARSVARIATEVIKERAGRRVHLKLPNGAEVTIEGGSASAEALDGLIVKLVDEDSSRVGEGDPVI